MIGAYRLTDKLEATLEERDEYLENEVEQRTRDVIDRMRTLLFVFACVRYCTRIHIVRNEVLEVLGCFLRYGVYCTVLYV